VDDSTEPLFGLRKEKGENTFFTLSEPQPGQDIFSEQPQLATRSNSFPQASHLKL
jgi:hypothetical protein